MITEDDLATLEDALPALVEGLHAEVEMRPDIQDHIAMSKTILSNVRWNYRPHTNKERIDP
jgi:hypothetical protein